MASAMSPLTRKLEAVLAPLSRREERDAVQVAVAHLAREVGGLEGVRYRVLGAELRIEKAARPGAVPPRLIQVLVVDYTHRRNWAITVGPRSRVTESRALEYQPRFHADEIAEARRVAERDERVARHAQERGVFVSEFAPEPAPDGSRLVGLHYMRRERDGSATPLITVVLDLSVERVASVNEQSGGT